MEYDVSFSFDEMRLINDEKELENCLLSKAKKKYKVLKSKNLTELKLTITKKFVDARRKNSVRVCYRFVLLSAKELATRNKEINSVMHLNNSKNKETDNPIRPVVAGFGPCGIFASLILASNGLKPIVIERGSTIDKRVEDVENIIFGKEINPNSNVQFGEGGAGTFSDGKLFSGISSGYKDFILHKFVQHGADKDILYDSNPHVGTDVLRKVIKGIREEIISLGGNIYFDTLLTDIIIEDNTLLSVKVKDLSTNQERLLPTDTLILSIGHSSRDTFYMLNDKNISIQNKPFAVGVRIEHLRQNIDMAQWGVDTNDIPLQCAANYKCAVDTITGKKLFTFCMCPGGEVVSSATDNQSVCTNGMSYKARDLENSNSALLVPVDETDYGDKLFDGVKFQEKLEHLAFVAGGSDGFAPVMTYKGLKNNDFSMPIGKVKPSFKPGTRLGDFNEIFDSKILTTIIDGIAQMGKKIKGFDDDDAVLTAVEGRSSSPVRIVRDFDSMQSISISGIYPAGEGAGYAGGIMSSAVDGIKTAVKIISDK